MPLMYGRTEAESSGPRGGLKPLSDLAKLLLPRPVGWGEEEELTETRLRVPRLELMGRLAFFFSCKFPLRAALFFSSTSSMV